MGTSSKDKKEKKKSSKEKKSSKSSKKSSKSEAAPAAAPLEKVLSPEQEYEASQLFLLYDYSRSGEIDKCDFQRLIKDVNGKQNGTSAIRPFTLTDFGGSPLGFERTKTNTQFEAGQLFERYDKDRSGALNQVEFKAFYLNFKNQLSQFYYHLAANRDIGPATKTKALDDSMENMPKDTANNATTDCSPELRSIYNMKLAELQDLMHSIKPRMIDMRQREESINQEIQKLSRRSKNADSGHTSRVQELLTLSELQNGQTRIVTQLKWIEGLKSKLDAREAQKHDSTIGEIRSFLESFELTKDSIREWKENTTFINNDNATTPKCKTITDDSQKENDSFKNLYEDAMKMLSIKDEMIWELLQERDAMRKESDAMMKELHDVSQASASELQEWARLTDDMAIELQKLRAHAPVHNLDGEY